jgi:hypothetical protein
VNLCGRCRVSTRMRSLLTLSLVVLFAVGCTPTGGDKPTNVEVCEHVGDLMKRELVDVAGTRPDETVDKFRETCVAELEKEEEKIGAVRFNAMVACVMATPELDGLLKCDERK